MQNLKKHEIHFAPQRPQLAAMGMEAEFALLIDGIQQRPEDVFRTPRGFIRGDLMHRTGTSYHLPTGGAVYFDTGVIELATPLIEIERGCAARAGRSLWESIRFVRNELDEWDHEHDTDSRLVGFSAHYNVSFEHPPNGRRNSHGIEALAHMLTWALPAPVMLLATNRRSTGVGVRPRRDRIEVTVDFTPSPSLMIATASVIVGIVRDAMTWDRFAVDELIERDLPVIREFRPIPHTTRNGWLARFNCYPLNPFVTDIDAPLWETFHHGTLSMRDIAARIVQHFRDSIRQLADPFTFGLIESVLQGRSPSLLELHDRPEAYEDVGRLCDWDELLPPARLDRSLYERVMLHAISGQCLNIGPRSLRPVGMKGWSAVVFEEKGNGQRRTIPLDGLVRYLDRWEGQLDAR